MPILDINGHSIHFQDLGPRDGEPVVLLHHGFGCDKMWHDIAPALTAAGFRVLTYDRRGYGRSEGGPDFMDFYVSDRFRPQSVDELGRLTAALGLDSFHLVGQCEGGVIALQFAARYSNRARSVTVSSTLCHSERTLVEFNREKFPKSFAEMDEGMREKLIDWHGPERAEPFFEQFRSFGGAYGKDVFDLRPLLPLVTCPALVLYPDRSFLFEVEQGVDMYRGLPKGELAVLPRCGHNTYENLPGEYARTLIRFLDRVSGEAVESFDPTASCAG